jgi:hypothetical protein
MVARLRIQQSAQLVARHPPWLELLRDAELLCPWIPGCRGTHQSVLPIMPFWGRCL